MNQVLWEIAEPSEYYMEVVRAIPDAPSRWAVHVRDGKPVSIQSLDTGSAKYPLIGDEFDSSDLTVEQVFAIADRFCVDRGVLECRLEFDPHFHYPKQVDSYEFIFVAVERFVSCEGTKGECLPHQ